MSEAVQEQKRQKITSPEELHDYIHVTGPGLWIVLTMIIVFLAALIVFSSTISMENTMDVQVKAETVRTTGKTELTCVLADSRKDLVKVGMKVRVAGEEGSISELFEQDGEEMVLISMNREDARLREGVYDAEIVLEAVSPVSFLLN